MFDFAKKSLYIGLGLANMTKEKVEAFAKEFAERAKMSEDEGRKFADYLHAESKKARESMRETVEQMTQAAVKRLPCGREIARLEARIVALEQAAGITPPADLAKPADDLAAEQPAPSAE